MFFVLILLLNCLQININIGDIISFVSLQDG